MALQQIRRKTGRGRVAYAGLGSRKHGAYRKVLLRIGATSTVLMCAQGDCMFT